MSDSPKGASLYDHPELYDHAFGYRDIKAEIDTLLGWRETLFGAKKPGRFLELAAGPARHAIEVARRRFAVSAIDLSPAMCEYATRAAKKAGVPISVIQADFTNFALPVRFDLIATFLDSLSHILSLEAMISHFITVAQHLEPSGIYAIEMAHPADFLTMTKRTKCSWEFFVENKQYRIDWGLPTDQFDSTTQIAAATVQITDSLGNLKHQSKVPMRRWTALEIEAAARLSAKLRIHSKWGGFEAGIGFDDSPRSGRMITLLTPLD